MEEYLKGFMHWEKNKRPKLLLMAEFVYNNPKNICTSHFLFKLNCKGHLRVFFEDKTNF